MSHTSTTDRKAWMEQLDRLTRERAGQQVTIEILDPTYGDQSEAERLPFAYASYDPKDDVVVVAVGGGSSAKYPVVLRHMVWRPTEVDVDNDAGAGAVRIVDADGATTITSLVPTGQA